MGAATPFIFLSMSTAPRATLNSQQAFDQHLPYKIKIKYLAAKVLHDE
jgi:hypothetical protein